MTKSTLIEFSASPSTKAIIDGVEDLVNDGFVVWAANSSDGTVFGTNGTKVYHGNPSGPLYPSWTYDPPCYWFAMEYAFAAVLPASEFVASHATTNPTSGIVGQFDGANLTLGFGDGFDISTEDQPDIMYAYATVDNTAQTNPTVGLVFNKRLCAQLNIQMYSDIPDYTFDVTSVTIYGINKKIAGELVIPVTADADAAASVIQSHLKNNGTVSTVTDYFAHRTPAANATWTIDDDKNNPTKLLTGLLVFPEMFETDNATANLKIDVAYGNGDVITYTLSRGSWLPNNVYTYTLKASAINTEIAEPTVTPWVPVTTDNPEIEIM